MSNRIAYAVATLVAVASISIPLVVVGDDDHGKGAHAHTAGEKDEHGHGEGEAEKEEEHGHGADEKDEHGHAATGEDGHGHGEEEGGHGGGGGNVGPDKGILEASEKDGFKLSPEAFKNFGVKSVAITTGKPMTLSRKSIFYGLQERNVYRLRNGFFKRIDFATNTKTKTELTITITDAQAGDQVVTEGVGFLRIAELAAFGGVSDSHSH